MSKSKQHPPRILLLMSGSIAAFKVAQLISMLVKPPHAAEIEVVRTDSVSQFIGDASLEGLTGRRVRHSLWESGQAMSHIQLVRWADLILVAPCTAHTLNRFAHGLGDDLLTTSFLAHDFRKPWLIAPAMNTSMYRHPTTQESLRRLAEMGCVILPTAHGELACGEIGEGRLLEATELLHHIQQHLPEPLAKPLAKPLAQPLAQSLAQSLAPPDPKLTPPMKGSTASSLSRPVSRALIGNPLRVLVTAGGTRVPLDDVRDLRGRRAALDLADEELSSSSEMLSLCNSSTGRTGVSLAESLYDRGHHVTLLAALSAPQPERPVDLHRFDTFFDLQHELETRLQNTHFDVVIHAAAVSDWLPEQIATGKIESHGDRWILSFQPAPKLIAKLQSWSKNPQVRIVGFKLTSRASRPKQAEKIQQVFTHPGVAAVIANELSEWPLWSFNTPDRRVEVSSREQMPEILDQWLHQDHSAQITPPPEVQI